MMGLPAPGRSEHEREAGPREDALRPSLLLTAGRSAAFAATFFTPLILARVFGPHEFGTYKQLFLLYYTFYWIAQLGMSESLFYFLPGARRDGGRWVANSVLFLAGAGVSSSVLLLLSAGTVARSFANADLARYVPVLAAFLALTMASAGLEIVLVSRGRHLGAALSYALSDAVRALCLIVPAVLLRDLYWVLVGAAAFAALRLGAAIRVYRAEFAGGLRPDVTLLREQMAYAVPFGAVVLVDTLQANLHQFAVSSLFDPATFAVYAVGCLQIPFVELVAGPACNVMMVGMRESLRDGDRRRSLELWRETTAWIASLVVPLFACLLLTSRELIVVLFTETYAPSVPVFRVWAIALILAVLQTDGALRVFAETRYLLVLSLSKLLIVALSIAAFVPVFHLPGAALATVLALAAAKVLALARIRRLLGVGFDELLPWRRLALTLALAAAAALPVLVLRSRLEMPPAPLLLTTSLGYGAVYGALFLSCRALGRARERSERPERAAPVAWRLRPGTRSHSSGG